MCVLLLLQSLVDIIKHGLTDENQKVKTITSLSIAALAEAAAPYGIESFDDVLEPLWKGIRLLRCASMRCSSQIFAIVPKTYMLHHLCVASMCLAMHVMQSL